MTIALSVVFLDTTLYFWKTINHVAAIKILGSNGTATLHGLFSDCSSVITMTFLGLLLYLSTIYIINAVLTYFTNCTRERHINGVKIEGV